jgi:hypothetical protein
LRKRIRYDKEFQDSILNKKFGFLTVKKFLHFVKGEGIDRTVLVNCSKCGKDVEKIIYHLIRGKYKTCGKFSCRIVPKGFSAEDLTGNRYGKLTVLYRAENKNKRVSWTCKCECGGLINAYAKSLKRGITKQCKNYIHISGKNNPSWKGYEEIPQKTWSRMQRGATERNLNFNISIDYIWNLFIKQNRRCNLSGMPISFAVHSKKCGTASLDRIDSSKGYIEENVQWVHKDVNLIKMNLNQDYFINLCNLISTHRKEVRGVNI